MLLNDLPRNRKKSLCLLVQNAPLRQFLDSLLRQWRYEMLDCPFSADLVLVEEGLAPPPGSGTVLWLGRCGAATEDRLVLPLSMEELWGVLESSFNRPPRNHIRIQYSYPVTVRVRGEKVATRISSLSDMGTRFDFDAELVNGEEIETELDVGQHSFCMEGRVIYVVPCGHDRRFQVGLIFDRTAQKVRLGLRHFIIGTFLGKVEREVGEAAFSEGRRFFDLPPEALKFSGCS